LKKGQTRRSGVLSRGGSAAQQITIASSRTFDKSDASDSSEAFQLRIRFFSSLSTVTTQYVSISVLTTISIIVSTAATLWGSQEKIKDGIVLVKTKVEEYLTKKRKANLASQAEA
jgi:hypothetical protein